MWKNKLKYWILLFVCGLSILFLLFESSLVGKSVQNAIHFCSRVVIPSLFPFLVISGFIGRAGLCRMFGRFLSPLTNLLFHLPGSAACVILMGIIGGYPVGASMIAEMLERNEITPSQARRMLAFCVNPGPAFVISAVGVSMLQSKRAGILLFFSLVISSLLIGIVSGFSSEKVLAPAAPSAVSSTGIIDSFVLATADACHIILSICGWVLLFSAFTTLLPLLHLPLQAERVLSAVVEVTMGISNAAGTVSIPAIAFFLGFGGLCVQFQIFPNVTKTGMRPALFLLTRLIHGSVAALFCYVLLLFFPCEVMVFGTSSTVTASLSAASIPAVICLLGMSFLLVLEVDKKIKA